MFLAVLRAPAVPDVDVRAAAATGLARADAQRRLAGTLPRVILVADADECARARERLEAAGFIAIAVEPASAPTDDDRLVARKLDLGASALGVILSSGERHEVPWSDLAVIQRGNRTTESRSEVTSKEKKISVGATLLAGGIPIRKTTTKTETRVSETVEPFVILQFQGGDDVMLYERRLDYSFLGGRLEPMSRANLERTLAEIRARAPAARYDDRLLKPGFVIGFPQAAIPAVDLAIHLVRLDHALGR